MKRLLLAIPALLLAMTAIAADVTPPLLPSDAEVRSILVDRIDTQRRGVGIVVGLVDPSGRRIVSYGTFDRDDRLVDGTTIFEIGSATKVFTALLLADAVMRGEVALDDPVSKFLPSTVKVPERAGKKIRLANLATHTSGLPRLPSNLMPKDPANPFADYTVAQLYDFLAAASLPRDIGSKYEYSNLGAGLLGHALALRAGTDYATLVKTRITAPLSMKNTVITLDETQRKRLAPGHGAAGRRAANWDLPALAGAGAIRSNADDLLTFLAANLGLSKSALAPAMTSMLKTRHATEAPGLEIALGWHVTTKGASETVWHNGGTGGYRSFLGFNPAKRTGVVVLSNMSFEGGVDDIGMHLLDPSVPLAAAAKQRKEMAVDAKVLEGLTGQYQLAPGFILTVTREGNRLMTQATGQSKIEVFAESPTEYFLKVTDAQLTFQTDAAGRATGLVLHQGGRDVPAKRIGDAVPAKERKQIAVDAAVLERYAGRYQLAPGVEVTITREGDRLFLQVTAQPRLELFAEGDREFFLKEVDAQVTFVSEGTEKAKSLVLHQSGRDIPGTRIE